MKSSAHNIGLLSENEALEDTWMQIIETKKELKSQRAGKVATAAKLTDLIERFDLQLLGLRVEAARMTCVCCKE